LSHFDGGDYFAERVCDFFTGGIGTTNIEDGVLVIASHVLDLEEVVPDIFFE
jgi:hypothetical protein